MSFRIPDNFWLRLAIVAGAACWLRPDAPPAPDPTADVRAPLAQDGGDDWDQTRAAQDPKAPADGTKKGKPAKDQPGEDRGPGSLGAVFVAARPEVQDAGNLLRFAHPREPISGLRQPVQTPPSHERQILCKAQFPHEPDVVRAAMRPIVRHGPPLA